MLIISTEYDTRDCPSLLPNLVFDQNVEDDKLTSVTIKMGILSVKIILNVFPF